MDVFSIDWDLSLCNNSKQQSHKINAEWSIVCHYKQSSPFHRNQRPESLEICRTSKAEDVLVSVNCKLERNSGYVVQQSFIKLIKAGSTTVHLQLEYQSTNSQYNDCPCYITGTLMCATLPDNKPDRESLQKLSNDFGHLLEPKEGNFSDVSLRCGTVSIPAHKSILSARSLVFATMFTTDMRESLKSEVDIVDISLPVLKTMLTYVYTGKTGDLSVQSAGELLFAADKYQLEDLKRVCTDYLKSCVSSKNVLSTLVLGYLHDKSLLSVAMDFICNKCEEFAVLETTKEWEDLRKKKPKLAMDILTVLVKSKEAKLKSGINIKFTLENMDFLYRD